MLGRYLRRSPVVPTTSVDRALFARGRPRLVRLEERYRCRQTVAPNSTIEWDQTARATGTVEILTPYDGDKHLTRDAVADIERRLGQHPEADGAAPDSTAPDGAGPGAGPAGLTEAVIGHLVLVGHQDTDLAEMLGLDGRFGAHEIRVPVSGPDVPDRDALADGLLEHSFAVDYAPLPGTPKLIPIRLEVGMTDPDSANRRTDLLKAFRTDDKTKLAADADAIKSFVTFKPHLQLTITARLTLPPGPDDVAPVLRRVGVSLPGALSLSRSSLRLLVGGKDPEEVQYDAVRNELAWFDVPIRDDDQPDDGEDDEEARWPGDRPSRPRRRMSVEMAVRFEQPGELYAQDKLVVTVDAEVPGELLSGTQARLFDARGYRHRKDDPLKVRSVVTTTCEVDLGHTFRRRPVTPYQSFHFDEVVPGRLRVADILAVLADQRFVTKDWELASGQEKGQMARHVIVATREDGPDVIELFIVVEGQRQNTRREIRSPDSSHRTKFISGDLWLYVYGEAPRDARTVVHEINKLQRSLRERFRQLRVPR
jgi:hypothetical protein